MNYEAKVSDLSGTQSVLIEDVESRRPGRRGLVIAALVLVALLIGGLLGSAIGNVTGFLTANAGWVMYLITAFVGAVVLLAAANMVQRGRVR